MADLATLTFTRTDRDHQIEARKEIRANCLVYLATPESGRNPDTAEQIIHAVLEYFNGEEMAEGGTE